ncbi:MAG: ZIP family metal transporter [Bdellovibrionales bacterium]
MHNFPEGLAVGSSIGGQSFGLALPVIAGIGLQDLPEGFVVAASLLSVGYGKMASVFVAVITGVVESFAAVIGLLMTSSTHSLLPWALAFAGGAMVYVVLEEMIPEIRSKSPVGEGTAGVLFGFVLMMILDVALGG